MYLPAQSKNETSLCTNPRLEHSKVVIEENFDSKGIYSGNYFEGDDQGDTLIFGKYKNGKKEGKWIEIGSDSARQYIIYQQDSVVKRN